MVRTRIILGALVVVATTVLSLQALSAETTKKVTADSIIDKMVENASKIKTFQAELTSVNSALQTQEGQTIQFKHPGKFRMNMPESVNQPETAIIMDDDKILSWLIKDKILNRDPQRSMLHPALVFTLNPDKIRSFSSSVRLGSSYEGQGEYTLFLTIKENPLLSESLYNQITVYISKENYTISRIEISDKRDNVSISTARIMHSGPDGIQLPVSWKNTVPGDLFFSESTMTDIKINEKVHDETFDPELPKDIIFIDDILRSEEEYKTAIGKDPADVGARYNYGLLLAGKGEHLAAKAQFEQVVKLRPDSVPAKILLASALAFNGENDKALALCDKIVDTPSLSSLSRMQIARVYTMTGENEKALVQYRKIIKQYPKDIGGYESAVQLLVEKPKEANLLINGYLKTNNNSLYSRFLSLKLYSILKDNQQFKQKANSLLSDKNISPWIVEKLGTIFWSMKNFNDTIAAYEKLIEMAPEHVSAYAFLSSVYGQINQNEKQIKLAQKLEKLESADNNIYTVAASIYSSAGELDEAIRMMEQALELAPFTQETYFNLAQLYAKAEKKEKLKKLIEDLFSNCPADSKTFFTAGAMYEELKETNRARDNYQKATLSGNLDVFQSQHILSFYLANEMKNEAKATAEIIIKNSQNAQTIFLAANVFAMFERSHDAIKAAGIAAELSNVPSDIWTYRLFIAQLHFQNNEKDEAEKVLTELVKQRMHAPNPKLYRNAQMTLDMILKEKDLSGDELVKYIDDLIALIKKGDLNEKEREQVKSALIKKGQPAVSKVLPLLDNKRSIVKQLALQILAGIGDPLTAPQISKCLDDDDPRVLIEAVKATGKLKDVSQYDKLTELLKEHEVAAVRAAAAEALGELGDKKAVGPLVDALSDKEKRMIFPISQALIKLGDKSAVEPLLLALNKETGASVRTWLAEALARFEMDEGYKHLEVTIASGNEIAVKEAIIAIVTIPGERSFKIFEKCFENKNPVVRKYAAMAAHQKTDRDVMPLLLNALDDEELAVRYGAIISFQALGRKEPIAPLEKLREKEKDESIITLIDKTLKMLKELD